MEKAAPDVIRSPVMARHPLSAAERTASVLRDNSRNPFCTPISRSGINTESKSDTDKASALRRASI